MSSPFNRYNLGLFNSGTYTPFVCNITAVAQGQQTTLTTAVDHGFVVGNQIQVFIPPQWGILQLNGKKGFVTAIPSATEITVNIDSSIYDAFVPPSVPAYVVIDRPQVSPIGDANFGNLAPSGVLSVPQTIPGAFYNIAP